MKLITRKGCGFDAGMTIHSGLGSLITRLLRRYLVYENTY